jgi:ubiquinone/menaquinone biosynthesis C-methylase UbiE
MTSSTALVRHWDRQAATYDAKTAGAERRLLRASRAWVCSRALGSTLEVAVGTGANLGHYPDQVSLTAVDWSSAMVEAARRRGDRERRAVDVRPADATALPFPDASFDSVVITFSLCCIPDERAALREALRVLRPGGRLLLADHVAAAFWPLRALQHVVDLVSVPLHGEHYTRRPLAALGELGVRVEETERLTLGTIERVHARKPGPAGQ